MSWNGMKKSISRAGTTLMQKTGTLDRTTDHDFNEQEARYKTYEKECLALQKEAKRYWDAMKAVSDTQCHLPEHLEKFYTSSDRTSDGAMAVHAYKQSVEDHNAGLTRELEMPYRTIVSEPAGKMCVYFPIVNEHISKRGKKMLDYDSARSRYHKQSEKPSEDPTKLPKAEQEYETAKETYEMLNTSLIDEIPEFLALRIPFFDPTFEGMIRMQAKFAQDGYEKMSGVQRYFPDEVRDDYASGQLDAQVEDALNEMKSLSICGAMKD